MEFKVKILNHLQVQKKDKTYNLVRLYIDFSDVVITCFVSKETYEKIENGLIDDDNIINYLHFKVDSNMKFSCTIH